MGLLAAASAFGQALYKWVDADGKAHYGEKPPAGFKGAVTRIDLPDEKAADEKMTPNAKRRAERERLTAKLEAARAKLETARKALAEGDEPQEGERIYMQQRFERNERRPERTPAPHVNCMSQYSADGKPIWNCPRPVPNEAYYDRQKALEEAVRKAEEELADAEREYRRGVD